MVAAALPISPSSVRTVVRGGSIWSLPVRSLKPATATEAARMRDKLTKVYALIAADVGMDLWNETQAELTKIRAKK